MRLGVCSSDGWMYGRTDGRMDGFTVLFPTKSNGVAYQDHVALEFAIKFRGTPAHFISETLRTLSNIYNIRIIFHSSVDALRCSLAVALACWFAPPIQWQMNLKYDGGL